MVPFESPSHRYRRAVRRSPWHIPGVVMATGGAGALIWRPPGATTRARAVVAERERWRVPDTQDAAARQEVTGWGLGLGLRVRWWRRIPCFMRCSLSPARSPSSIATTTSSPRISADLTGSQAPYRRQGMMPGAVQLRQQWCGNPLHASTTRTGTSIRVLGQTWQSIPLVSLLRGLFGSLFQPASYIVVSERTDIIESIGSATEQRPQ